MKQAPIETITDAYEALDLLAETGKGLIVLREDACAIMAMSLSLTVAACEIFGKEQSNADKYAKFVAALTDFASVVNPNTLAEMMDAVDEATSLCRLH